MSTLRERIEANADLTLWCVHVLGPDELYASPCHEAAVATAAQMNKTTHRKADEPNDVMCFAYAAPWPHSRGSHAAALAELKDGGRDA